MAINFPNSPTDGATYNDGAVVWTYTTGSGWSKPVPDLGSDENLLIDPTVDSLGVGMNAAAIAGMSGTRNTIVGRDTGSQLAAGDKNTIVGAGAGKVLANGTDNTLVGQNAGGSLGGVNAHNNTFIGSGAQGTFSQSRSCTVIGNSATTASTDETDSVVIGEGAKGQGTGTVVLGNESVTDTHLKGAVHLEDGTANYYLKLGADGETVEFIANPAATAIQYLDVSLTELESPIVGETLAKYYRLPYDFTLSEVWAWTVNNISVEDTIIDIHDNGGTTIFTDKIHLEIGEKTSLTATTPPALSTTTLTKGDLLTFYYDQSNGISETHVYLVGYKT